MRAWKNLCFGKSNTMKIISKKGQEEMVGFVLVVVIVAVIFLVFLAIFVRQITPATQKGSGDVFQYLESMMQYTTDCAIRYEPAFSSLDTLIGDCYSDSMCVSGKSACETLNRTLREAIKSNWNIGADRPTKGYMFNSTYKSGTIINDVIYIQEGNCSGNKIGAEYSTPEQPGDIINTLTFCS